jgi:hypothetical protein
MASQAKNAFRCDYGREVVFEEFILAFWLQTRSLAYARLRCVVTVLTEMQRFRLIASAEYPSRM